MISICLSDDFGSYNNNKKVSFSQNIWKSKNSLNLSPKNNKKRRFFRIVFEKHDFYVKF